MFKKIHDFFFPPPKPDPVNLRAMRVMVVDDNAADRKLISSTLMRAGCYVVEAFTGERALSVARRHALNAIVLDCRLPGISGEEVCRRLKTDPKTRCVPVVFLTAVGDGSSILRCYELGANVYLAKPVNPKVLLLEVATAIEEERDVAFNAGDPADNGLESKPGYGYSPGVPDDRIP